MANEDEPDKRLQFLIALVEAAGFDCNATVVPEVVGGQLDLARVEVGSFETYWSQKGMLSDGSSEGVEVTAAAVDYVDELLADRFFQKVRALFLEKRREDPSLTYHLWSFQPQSDWNRACFVLRNKGLLETTGGRSSKGFFTWKLTEKGHAMIEHQDADPMPRSEPTGHRIFLVHGHDEAVIQTVARFLERLDQEVIILREQPNSGRTIIEKFEDYADVGFAVVILTGDDRGGTKDAKADDQKPRARQNVILELGYFLGRLGRDRVCVLYQEGVEIPSDYSGVLYTPLDKAGAWRLDLAKELKAAGLSVDMNKAL
jgi:predicted nucleotide-binding protein